MSRFIMFSRVFPSYHIKKGQETFFREKIWCGIADTQKEWGFTIPNEIVDWDWHQYYNGIPKFHTIRAGHRWKVGDKFSPRVWSGQPYKSKQIIIAPDIEIKKTFDLRLQFISRPFVTYKNEKGYNESYPEGTLEKMAINDGFSNQADLEDWLLGGRGWDPVFEGQVICWNENIQY